MFRYTINRYRAAFAGLPREIWLLSGVLFVNRCGSMVLPFLTLYLTSQLEMSEAAAGRMVSVYGLGSILGVYFGGRLTTAIGAVRLQTVCMLLAVPGFLILPLWQNWHSMAISLFMLSLVNEAVRPANATAIAKLSTIENRTRAFGLQRLAANLGFSFGPAIGGLLATIDFRLLFVVDAGTTLVAGILLLAFFRMRRIEGEAPTRVGGPTNAGPLKDRIFVAFLLLTLANAIVFFQLGSTYPLYLRDHFRFTKPLIGLMFAVNTIVIVAFEMILVDSIKKWSLMRTIGAGSLLSCLGLGMLPFGNTGLFCVAAMLVLTVGEMLSFPISASFVANRARPGNEGSYMGWYTLIFSVAAVLGPGIGSAIYQVNRDALWIAGLAVGVVVFIGFELLALRLRADKAQGENERDGDQQDNVPLLATPVATADLDA